MAYYSIEAELGLQAITDTSTTQRHPLGHVVRAKDSTFGQGTFIYLLGVASTIVGSVVVYDGTTYQTTLAPITANQGRPIGVAMSANPAASYGWYQQEGTAVVAKSAVAIAPLVALGINSVGKVGNVASGKQILNARTANAATVASATGTINVVMQFSGLQGRTT